LKLISYVIVEAFQNAQGLFVLHQGHPSGSTSVIQGGHEIPATFVSWDSIWYPYAHIELSQLTQTNDELRYASKKMTT